MDLEESRRRFDGLAAAVDAVADPGTDDESHAAALQMVGIDAAQDPEQIRPLLAVLRDRAVPAARRVAVLKAVQQVSFRLALFPGLRPDYLDALRSLIDDPDATLRRRAIGMLARERDGEVQQRLLDGLTGAAPALVPVSKAVQFLGYDVHAEHFPVLRRIAEHPPSAAARKEALRVLAADPGSADLLAGVLADRAEDAETRRICAAGLRSLAPDRFAALARRIVLDDEEDDQLRAMAITALTLSGEGVDAELGGRIEQLGAESASRQVKRASSGYLARRT